MSDGALIGAALRRERIRCGRSLPGVAARAGIAKSALWSLEQGHTENPTIGTVRSVCAALNYPVEHLVQEWLYSPLDNGPSPVPDEFPDDDTQDYNEEDVVT